MTTGRINQVAALVAGPRSPDPKPPENSRAEARQALTECRELNTGQAKQPSALRRPPLNLSPRGPAVHSSRPHQRSGDTPDSNPTSRSNRPGASRRCARCASRARRASRRSRRPHAQHVLADSLPVTLAHRVRTQAPHPRPDRSLPAATEPLPH